MLEKISLKRRMFEFSRREFLELHPAAKSTFRCSRCEYPVLIERDEYGCSALCACLNVAPPERVETLEQWEQHLKLWDEARP
jgi:hypothetical protein